jgi:hypothetical protein
MSKLKIKRQSGDTSGSHKENLRDFEGAENMTKKE